MKKYLDYTDSVGYKYIHIYDDEYSIYYFCSHKLLKEFFIWKDHKIGRYQYSLKINNGNFDWDFSKSWFGTYWTDLEKKNIEIWNKALKEAQKYLILI